MKYIEYLNSVLIASKWSQERLAKELDVSFVTLNSWINNKSTPRLKAQARIEELYFSITGNLNINNDDLNSILKKATAINVTAKNIITNKDYLKKLSLYLTYNTNTIEGSTMTLADVGEVIFDNKVLSNRTAIEQLEAKNHQSVLLWIIDQLASNKFELDTETIKSIHLRLMNGIVSDAGVYRNHSVRIQGSRTTVTNYVKIPDLMDDLILDAKNKNLDAIVNMTNFHSKFEKIHPFSDGNGRTGRLILIIMALKSNLVPPIILKEKKHAYYKYLESAQMDDKFIPLQYFIASSIISTQELFGL